jgi:hypothetical protein
MISASFFTYALFFLAFLSLNYKHTIFDVGFSVKAAHLFVPLFIFYFKPYLEIVKVGLLWILPVVLLSIYYDFFIGYNTSFILNDYFKWLFWYLAFCSGYIFSAKLGSVKVERMLVISILALVCVVMLKNFLYIDKILYMYIAGGAHPRSDWNFYNVGYNINNEVTWIVMYVMVVGFAGIGRFANGVALINSLVSKVNGAVLLYPMWFFLVSINKVALTLRYAALLFMLLLLVYFYLGVDFDDVVEVGSGRIDLWDYWLFKVQQFDIYEILFGLNLGAMVSDPVLESHLVADFHNVYMDIFYEQGLLGLGMFMYFVLVPVVRSTVLNSNIVDYGQFKNRLAIVILLCCINGLFSFRPLDPIFPFIFGIWMALQSMSKDIKFDN